MRRNRSYLLLAVFLAACNQSHPLPIVPEPGDTVTEMVGPAGATLRLAGFEIEVPPGALASDTQITVTATDAAAPSFLVPFSPVMAFEPEGLEFAVPIEVRLPFAGDPARATVFWSAREGGAYVARTTRIDGSFAITESTHFSQAFVGAACQGADCCGPANGLLDVVLLVDDSNSMSEEQALLQAQIPRFARALASGDSDGDGVQDFPALESVRLGVVSSDMGASGFMVPTCTGGDLGADFGDDGILRTAGHVELAGCGTSYPMVAEFGADSPDLEGFVEQVRCVGTLGTGGCGFEQQLESVLKASTPSTAGVRFFSDTLGHGDIENADLFRDDSLLALVVMTDEDDCSVAVPELLDPASPTYTGDLNLRCHEFPDAVYSTSRYVDGFLALRSDPADLIYATIAGVPAAALSDDYDAILAHPDMQELVDPAMPSRLLASCSTPGLGNAMPPRRLVTVARDLDAAGASGVVGSICESDFAPVVDRILDRVAARVRGECH